MSISLWTIVGSAVGIAFGWVLGQFGQWLSLRQQRKQALSVALSELLEIRHRVRGESTIYGMMKARIPNLPREAEAGLRVAISQIFPVSEDIPKRYEAAVSMVAKFDPMLAFRLRSQPDVFSARLRMQQMSAADPRSLAIFPQMDDILIAEFSTHLDSLLVELGQLRSRKTGRQVKDRLAQPGGSKEAERVLDKLIASVHALEKSAAAANAPND